jgi:hypothetical protein
VLLAAVGASGCNTFDFLSTTAVEGVVVGASVTDGVTPLSGGPALGLFFLADATSIQDFSENLIVDADVVTLSAGAQTADLASDEPGLWMTDTLDGASLPWQSGETYLLEMERGGRAYSASVEAPPPPTLAGLPSSIDLADLPADWTQLTAEDLDQLAADVAAAELLAPAATLSLDVTEEYEYWLVMVVDQDGALTYTNVPTEAGPLVTWLLESEPITTLDIPGTAFPEPNTLYAVGVAGLEFTSTQNYAGFNWLISNVAAGTMTVAPVLTGDGR